MAKEITEAISDFTLANEKIYQRGKIDGAKEFVEWLATKRGFSKEWVKWHIDQWQKEGENG